MPMPVTDVGDRQSHKMIHPPPEPIPVLSLWQPWASLIALEVKWIETRSWATKYRGPIALAAAARRPRDGMWVGDYHVRGFGRSGLALEGPNLPPFRSTPRLEGYIVPLGKIVATATLDDVVPMLAIDDPAVNEFPETGKPQLITVNSDGLELWETPEFGYVDVTNQGPYGDFAPGRFGWLLSNIVPLERPVPFKGGQRLTRTWTPTR